MALVSLLAILERSVPFCDASGGVIHGFMAISEILSQKSDPAGCLVPGLRYV